MFQLLLMNYIIFFMQAKKFLFILLLNMLLSILIICKDCSTKTVKPVASKETMAIFDDFAATYATQTFVGFSHLPCNEDLH